MQTISKAKLGALITALAFAKMTEVQRAISFALGFDSIWTPMD